MANHKLSSLSSVTTTLGTSLLYVVQDPSSTPASKSIAVSNLLPIVWQGNYAAIVLSQQGLPVGNARGDGAVDLNFSRSGPTKVASGQFSAMIAGHDLQASGNNAGCFVGHGNNAVGNKSVALGGTECSAIGIAAGTLAGEGGEAIGDFAVTLGGRDHRAGARCSATMGENGIATIPGQFVHGVGFMDAIEGVSGGGDWGDLQYSRIVLAGRTLAAGTTTLKCGPTSTVLPTIPVGYVVHFRGVIVGVKDNDANVYAIYTLENGVIISDAVETEWSLIGPTVAQIADIPTTVNPTVAIELETGELSITVAGAASAPVMRWVCTLQMVMIQSVTIDPP